MTTTYVLLFIAIDVRYEDLSVNVHVLRNGYTEIQGFNQYSPDTSPVLQNMYSRDTENGQDMYGKDSVLVENKDNQETVHVQEI